MADIDPNAIPFVPSTDVSLIDPGSGKPKTAFHDWMQSLWDWMKRSVVDLTTKITTLTADLGDLSAAIVTEATIRQTEDGILASQITTVSATANNAQSTANSATASGQIYFAAKAAPSGSAAAYGLYLTAGSAYAGFEALALSAGGSAIGMTANQFMFTDSGTAQAVFAYSAGVWYFTVPVVIQSGTSGARQVITNENTKIYDASNILRVAIGVNI